MKEVSVLNHLEFSWPKGNAKLIETPSNFELIIETAQVKVSSARGWSGSIGYHWENTI